MVEKQRPRNLRYFVAKFGGKHADADPVEGERYPLESKYWPGNFFASTPNNPITVGDVVLLYCTTTYPHHQGEIPSIGIVYCIDKGDDKNTLWYHHISLAPSINSNAIRTKLTKAGSLKDLHNILETGRSQYCFLRMINNKSAKVLLAGCQINWP